MIKDFFSFKTFIISFIIGLIYLYYTDIPSRSIFVYPTPNNINKIQYIDKTDNCYQYISKNIKCPYNKKDVKTIPIQQ